MASRYPSASRVDVCCSFYASLAGFLHQAPLCAAENTALTDQRLRPQPPHHPAMALPLRARRLPKTSPVPGESETKVEALVRCRRRAEGKMQEDSAMVPLSVLPPTRHLDVFYPQTVHRRP